VKPEEEAIAKAKEVVAVLMDVGNDVGVKFGDVAEQKFWDVICYELNRSPPIIHRARLQELKAREALRRPGDRRPFNFE
jgi:hypothetical protein